MIAVLLFGAAYFLIGAVFPNPPASDPSQFAWRLAAWVLSIAAFAGQVGIEHFRLHNKPRLTAFHTAAAVALGALAIAISANIRSINAAAGHGRSMVSAIVIWPLAGGLLAFVAAWVTAVVLNLVWSNDRSR